GTRFAAANDGSAVDSTATLRTGRSKDLARQIHLQRLCSRSSMVTKLVPDRTSKPSSPKKQRKKAFQKLVECNLMRRVSYEEYRDKVRDVYSGPQGALLSLSSALSLHTPFGERLLRERKFDLRGVK